MNSILTGGVYWINLKIGMVSSLSNFKWLFLVSSVTLAAAPPALAQATMKQGQGILFSDPVDNDITSNAPSLTPQSSIVSGFANTIEMPSLNYNVAQKTGSLPIPVISPADIQALQKQLDEKKNWALMTPAEILGVPTAEQIMNVPERDVNGEQKGQTVLERYYQREANQQNGRTNGTSLDDSSFQWKSSGVKPGALNLDFSPGENPLTGSPTLIQQFQNNTPWNETAAGQDANSAWPKLFGSPTPALVSKPTPQQLAADDQFQKLLSPHSAPVSADHFPQASTVFSGFSSTPGSTLGQPAVNSAGISFTPLSSGIATPVGVQPLTGPFAKNQNDSSDTIPVAPEWTPQLPPWMIQTPQPGVIPQRKF